jgi:hypothetical protein
MDGTLSPSPFQVSKPPGIARQSSGWFQLRRQLQRVITFNPCVVSEIREYRCVCLVEGFVPVLLIHLSDLWSTVNRQISHRLRRGPSSPVSKLHCFFSPFFDLFTVKSQPPSLSPSLNLPHAPLPTRWRWQPAMARPVPRARPSPRLAL